MSGQQHDNRVLLRYHLRLPRHGSGGQKCRYRTVDDALAVREHARVPRRSPTVWDELVRRSDTRHALRVAVFMETWYVTVREWESEPSPEQFGEAWDLKRGQVAYQLGEFRRLFPGESSTDPNLSRSRPGGG